MSIIAGRRMNDADIAETAIRDGKIDAFAHPEKVGQKVSTILHAVWEGDEAGNNI